MGTDIMDNTVFLEFYGLPGCGKSTISHLVAVELRKYGEIVDEPTYDIDHKYSRNVRKGIKFIKLIYYGLSNPKSLGVLCETVRSNGFAGFGVVNQMANIAYKLLEYDHPKANYVILDEGLIQSAIAITQGKKLCIDNEQDLFSLCQNRKVMKCYIEIDEQIAIERMASREKHDSRIEKLDCKNQTEALRVFRENCIGIFSAGNSELFDAKQPEMENVHTIIHKLL